MSRIIFQVVIIFVYVQLMKLMKTLTNRLPPYQFLIAFSQLISRICHPNSDVFTQLEVGIWDEVLITYILSYNLIISSLCGQSLLQPFDVICQSMCYDVIFISLHAGVV